MLVTDQIHPNRLFGRIDGAGRQVFFEEVLLAATCW